MEKAPILRLLRLPWRDEVTANEPQPTGYQYPHAQTLSSPGSLQYSCGQQCSRRLHTRIVTSTVAERTSWANSSHPGDTVDAAESALLQWGRNRAVKTNQGILRLARARRMAREKRCVIGIQWDNVGVQSSLSLALLLELGVVRKEDSICK